MKRRKRVHQEVDNLILQSFSNCRMGMVAAVELVAHDMLKKRSRWGGRAKGATNIRRGLSTWRRDYLEGDCVYPERLFRRRFGVPRLMFWRIHDDLVEHCPWYWGTRRVVGNRTGIDSAVKVLACLRILRTGEAYDGLDESARIGEETVRLYFRQFWQDLIEIYGKRFLNRRPTEVELGDIEFDYKEAGFRGCGGAIDCMKLIWKNCPLQEKGQYHNKKEGKMATIVAEGWCDRKLYLWSWFAGRAGTNNDLNVLAVSPLVQDIVRGKFKFSLTDEYSLIGGGVPRKRLYFLGDGIYPSWPLFVKPIHHPVDEHERTFTKNQEAIRKDIERCFGVLQARFGVLRRENRRWDVNEVVGISNACVVLHNMLVNLISLGGLNAEENDGNVLTELYDEDEEMFPELYGQNLNDEPNVENEVHINVEAYMEEVMVQEFVMTSITAHKTLMEELVVSFNEH